MRIFVLAAAVAWLLAVAAQPHSAGECREGGDFIRNAALSRDALLERCARRAERLAAHGN